VPLSFNNNANQLIIYPSLTFTCGGVITGVRMVTPSRDDRPITRKQEIFLTIAVFSGSAVSDVIVLKNDNVSQTQGTDTWMNNPSAPPLSTSVKAGDFIGLAVPRDNITGRSIYYQGVAAMNTVPRISIRQLDLSYNSLSEFVERVEESTVESGQTALLQPPLIQFTVEPEPTPPTSTTAFSPSSTPTSPSSSIGTDTIVAAAVVGGVVVVLVAMTAIILPIILCVLCRRRGHYSSDKEFGVKVGSSKQKLRDGFDNLHSDSPTSAEGQRGVSPVGVSSPHSPTTGQLHPPPGTSDVVYALPQTKNGDNKMDLGYEYAPNFLTVPTLAERSQYSYNMTSDGSYELPEIHPTQGTLDYEFPSTESQHYWCPAEEEEELYKQLSENKYQEVLRRMVRLEEKVGEGEFGAVYRGEWQQTNGCIKEVAVKRLHDNNVKVQFLREAAAMGQFNHQHVAKLFGVVTVGQPVMIVMELLPEGDLHSYLQSLNPSEDPDLTKRLLKFTRQICSGMVHLSSKRFVHRDLAARNILLDSNFSCKIADFGMSRDITNDYYLSQGGRIPLKWTSPEGILYQKYYPGSDIWSYGMVMYEIWSLGHKPYEALDPSKVVQMLSSGRGHCQPPPPGCPREVYSVMVKCWNWDHKSRPTFEKIFQLLDRDDSILTSIGEYSDLVPADGLVLGSPLRTSHFLHIDLQKTYDKAV
jgi:tRNA A-37 threonylcarbamoyl transferase component Bud32